MWWSPRAGSRSGCWSAIPRLLHRGTRPCGNGSSAATNGGWSYSGWDEGATYRGGALTAVAGAAPLPAQAVRGQLVDLGNGFPIGGAFVVLLDQERKEAARVLTGPDGTFLFSAPRPRTYPLQSKRIGFRVAESPPLTLAAGETIGYRLRVEAVPARLPPVVVEGRPQCGTRGEQGTAVAQLWEEAREALAAVHWTAGQRALPYPVERL